MAYKIFVVSGSFLLPGGSRKVVSLPPTKVIAETRQIASRELVPLLNKTFHKELARESRSQVGAIGFGDSFALCQLKWSDYVPKPRAVDSHSQVAGA